jgi:Flp pilus assembly protein TadB
LRPRARRRRRSTHPRIRDTERGVRAQPYGSQPHASQPGRQFSRNGYIIVSITPFIALILFFLSSLIWGWTYSWLWFLLVPIVGVIVYGGGYGNDRHRDRR